MGTIVWIWLALLVLLLVIEIATTSLTTIWFAGGALISFILAFIGVDLWIQIAVFVVVSLVLLIFTRPILTKLLKVANTKTNVEGLIGRYAVVSEVIDNAANTGRAKINGLDWTARAEDEKVIIEKDTKVEIVSISGVKLIVKKINQEEV